MLYKHLNATTLRIIWLYSGDYRRAFYTREIARSVNVDVKAVQIQLKRLERAGLLKSVVRGKNLEYRLNLNNLISEYYLILAENFAALMLLDEEPVIKKLVEHMKMHDSSSSLILFGSYAKRNVKGNSDIDLLAITKSRNLKKVASVTGKHVGKETNLLQMTEKAFADGIKKQDPLVIEVLSNHIVLWNADKFCNIVWDCYAGR